MAFNSFKILVIGKKLKDVFYFWLCKSSTFARSSLALVIFIEVKKLINADYTIFSLLLSNVGKEYSKKKKN